MKLWLLRAPEHLPNWERWYDKAFGFVVRAETEEAARSIAQSCGGDECGSYAKNEIPAWTEYADCEELTADGPEELVLRDFNAA